MTVYAIIDAPGSFGSAGERQSYVYETYHELEPAIRAARRRRQVQVISGQLSKGEVVYEDSIGSTYPSVWRRGDDQAVRS